jgi:hypothetical protein
MPRSHDVTPTMTISEGLCRRQCPVSDNVHVKERLCDICSKDITVAEPGYSQILIDQLTFR